MTEQWRDIAGYEGLYQVSDAGRVRSLSRPTPCKGGSRVIRDRILKYQLSGTVGYPAVVLYKLGAPRTIAIHRLVMNAFVGAPPAGHEVCHGNGNPLDNRLLNLRYDTRSANRRDGLRLGEIPLGEQRAFSKLTAPDVCRIREASLFGASARDLGAVFGVNPMTVGKILRRDTWKHLP